MRQLQNAWKALHGDKSGNVVILFAATAIPLLLIMGGAVDFARYARHKAALSNVVDSAALALARVGQKYTNDQATAFVETYVDSFPVTDGQFSIKELAVSKTDNGYIVTADAEMDTDFLPLGGLTEGHDGLMKMDMKIAAEVVFSSNRVELALVFDNTGSMSDSAGTNPCGTGYDRMSGLKCAATTLVGDLMDEMNDGDGEDQLKVALVPFEGAVNVGVDTSNPPWWIEWSNESTATDSAQPYYTGVNFDPKNFGTSGSPDYRKIGPKWLYNKLGISWAGCVEMRAEPYDLVDTPPDASVPDTLFLPMFWPDEPDSSAAWNDYLEDDASGGWMNIQRDLDKYDKSSPSHIDWHYHRKDTTYPYTYGPNRGCPRPITPLTSSETTIDSAIAAMQAQGATGTFIPAGVAWGWRVLSPEEPFTEGLGPDDEYYDKTIKAMIVLTDGANSPSIAATSYYNQNEATYSAFNYPATAVDHLVGGDHVYRRLQHLNVDSNPSDSRATNVLNDKTLALCTNVKATGVRLYTITFGSMNSATESLMENCASTDDDGNALYFSAPTSEELDDIFHTIGEDLSEIHLAM